MELESTDFLTSLRIDTLFIYTYIFTNVNTKCIMYFDRVRQEDVEVKTIYTYLFLVDYRQQKR